MRPPSWNVCDLVHILLVYAKHHQSNVFIGCVPEHNICAGEKNLYWSIMKWNGPFAISCTRTSIGNQHSLPTAPLFLLVPPAMHIGRQRCGTIWPFMLTNYLNMPTLITSHLCSFSSYQSIQFLILSITLSFAPPSLKCHLPQSTPSIPSTFSKDPVKSGISSSKKSYTMVNPDFGKPQRASTQQMVDATVGCKNVYNKNL